MDPNVTEWLHLLVRWMHVITGIMWIGSSIFFNWLDSHLTEPVTKKEGVEGELWMVHSGGFYQVEKKLVAPSELPTTLHWFKWEAAFTWISGLFLLGLVYYAGGGLLMVDPQVSGISPHKAMLIGIGTIVVAFAIYDSLWNSSLGKAGGAPIAITAGLIITCAFALSKMLSGRAAYIHTGAVMGTMMVGNVWMRIIPAQRALVESVKAGTKPDAEMAYKAKQRSRHNNYMTYPVLFIMISNHFPDTYGNKLNWAVLAGFMLFGAAVRHYENTKGGSPKQLLIALAAALAIAFVVSSLKRGSASKGGGGGSTTSVAPTVNPNLPPVVIDPNTVGTLSGTIAFSGNLPPPRELPIPSSCAPDSKGPIYSNAVLVADGKLQNAFVWISDGLGAWTQPPPKDEVIVDQRSCIYVPRVVGVMVGQPLTFVNSDPVMHNVHGTGDGNGFNAPMPGKAQRLTKVFENAEVMLQTKCDVHPWMASFIGVVPHPYFAVSGPKGEWSMPNVPPGEYTLEAWHEVFGKQSKKISLPAKGTVAVDLAFTGT